MAAEILRGGGNGDDMNGDTPETMEGATDPMMEPSSDETPGGDTSDGETTRTDPSDPSETENPVSNAMQRFLEPHLGTGSWKSVHDPLLCAEVITEANPGLCQRTGGRIHNHDERVESPFEEVDYKVVQNYKNFEIWKGMLRQDSDVRDGFLCRDCGGRAEGGIYYDRIGYAAELDHTLLSVSWERDINKESGEIIDPREKDPDFNGDATTHAGFYGKLSMTPPTGTGSASWSGVMIGTDFLDSPDHSEEPDWFLGDARVVIDNLSDPAVDVELTNIQNQSDGPSREDITWDNLPLTDEGIFFQGEFVTSINGVGARGDEAISGGFNGPNHEEVGGQFISRRNNLRGSFGARRE